MTTLVMHAFWMTDRRLKVLVKQPAFVLMLLVQPAIWLFLFGNLFRRVVELPGFGAASYLDHLIPGVVVMTAVSSNMWAGMGMLEEIERGTMNRLLTTPVARSAIMNAAVVEQSLSRNADAGVDADGGGGRSGELGARRGAGLDERRSGMGDRADPGRMAAGGGGRDAAAVDAHVPHVPEIGLRRTQVKETVA
ncbi:hypothetical protein Aca07nite_02380 [Actinoplanes capillaceus]|uniref:ABC-2 type transporter transmembrane domain-containing protein n=1 Tax=Actinoplanes campanulatus TaxID=113559 RepID=A0ABQ3WE36_9ACTN|nr:ABC transporter permease [Actinoplanes capillaceus]GID42963.1 hypothetical protein Aca07nite_02380 [Actinoplanes capillaceus]